MKYYVVNTNRRADPGGHDEQTMLNERIVALYFEGYKEKIHLMSEGDIVFLYANTLGIIAYGEISGETFVRDYRGMPKFRDEEYYRHLKCFVKLQRSLAPIEIKKIVGQKLSFARAFFEMDERFANPLYTHLSQKELTKLKIA